MEPEYPTVEHRRAAPRPRPNRRRMEHEMITVAQTPSPGPVIVAAKVRTVDLAGPAGKLEAVVNEGDADAPCSALVCHPHPLGGGSMHNKVVYHAMKALNAPEWGLGWPVLRFNFRGTGLSEGAHDGNAERDDVTAAIDWLNKAYGRPVLVVGFSFGAAMSLKAVCERSAEPQSCVRAIAALGLPTNAQGHAYHYSFLKNCGIPKLFLSGDGDQFAPTSELARVAEDAGEPRKVVLIESADHFFTGRLEPMQRALAAWVKEQVQ
jgi:alpha/beta superfamily hydrolase